MKIRNGYVSNSSSSSFIVAFNEKTIEFKSDSGAIIRFSSQDFKNHLENNLFYSESTSMEAVGKSDILTKINSWPSFIEGKRKEYFDKLKESIINSQEENLIMFSLNYYDEIAMKLLRAFIVDGSFRLIFSEMGEEEEK